MSLTNLRYFPPLNRDRCSWKGHIDNLDVKEAHYLLALDDMCNTLANKLWLIIRRAQEAEEHCDGLHVQLTETDARATKAHHRATKAEAAQKLGEDRYAHTLNKLYIPRYAANNTLQLPTKLCVPPGFPATLSGNGSLSSHRYP